MPQLNPAAASRAPKVTAAHHRDLHAPLRVLINALQLVQQRVLKRAAERAATWSEPSELRSRSGLLPVIQRIEVRIDRVDIHMLPSRLVVVQCARHSTGLRARTERPCPCR